MFALLAGTSGLVPGSSPRSAVTSRPAATFDRRDFAAFAAAAVAGIAAPAFAGGDKGPPPNLGGPPMAKQKSALGIVSYSKMPQFRDSKGVPIPDYKPPAWTTKKGGPLDPKVARPMFNK